MKEKSFTGWGYKGLGTKDLKIKKLLDKEVAKRDSFSEVNEDRLDPIIVAREYKDEFVALVCSLFAYGNVKQIVKFLRSLDFALLESDEKTIKESLKNHYYRFQTSTDVATLFTALSKIKKNESLEEIFKKGYKNKRDVIEGVNELIKAVKKAGFVDTQGYNFLISKETYKTKGAGALKRWMMYIRWMVRDDNIDLGLWKDIDKSDLIIPLDTHTFNVSKKLGLLSRKTYDLHAAIELTEKLKEFDKNDPLKYDFALYRIGQEKISI